MLEARPGNRLVVGDQHTNTLGHSALLRCARYLYLHACPLPGLAVDLAAPTHLDRACLHRQQADAARRFCGQPSPIVTNDQLKLLPAMRRAMDDLETYDTSRGPSMFVDVRQRLQGDGIQRRL